MPQMSRLLYGSAQEHAEDLASIQVQQKVGCGVWGVGVGGLRQGRGFGGYLLFWGYLC